MSPIPPELTRQPLSLQRNLVSYVIPGGALLSRFLGEAPAPGIEPPSQMWLASTVASALGDGTAGLSRVSASCGGAYLRDLLAADPVGFLGEEHARRWGSNPGILIKLLNSRDRLLVQVHPDREKARRWFGSDFGKTEAWYVLDAEPGARAYAGFRPGATRASLREAIDGQDSDRILGLLHSFPIVPGDALFIPAGLPHALGKDSLVMEIQEPTDITLRAERRRPSGELLPEAMLHGGAGMEALLDCFSYDAYGAEETRRRVFLRSGAPILPGAAAETPLVSYRTTPYFAMMALGVAAGAEERRRNDRFVVGLAVAGEGSVEAGGRTIPLRRGSEFFVPHGAPDYVYRSAGGLAVVECYPPLADGKPEEGR
jgi:mannose-6-phosphate isomerase